MAHVRIVMEKEARRPMLSLSKDHVGCGMLDCEVCGALFAMFCGEAETLRKSTESGVVVEMKT